MNANVLLRVEDVTVSFGGNRALSHVDLDVPAGTITGLIGPNGAGKTTLFNVITGLLTPSSGRVLLDGRDISRLETHKRARLGVARTFQRLELFTDLTVRDNLRVAAEMRNTWSLRGRRIRRVDAASETERVLELVGLTAVADVEVSEIPTGTARVVEMGRALMIRPRILLLDEPASGQTDEETKAFERLLRRLAAPGGLTILLIEHDMGLVMDACDRIHVLDFGETIAVGSPAQIRRDPRVQEAYLGDDHMNRVDDALTLRGVHAAYGTIDVLRGVDLTVPFGNVVGLLGPNGGGKSTTLRVIAGQLAPTAGDVFIAGRRVNGAAPGDLARRGVCLIPEGRGIFPNLSVRENLWMASYTGSPPKHIEEVAYARFPQLAPRRKQLAGTLSGGEQQMLALARALSTNPALLLLDELSMGLAPIVVEQLYEIVAQIALAGVSLLVVEQFAQAVLGIADWVCVMVRGRVAAFDRPAAVEAELSTAYLGD